MSARVDYWLALCDDDLRVAKLLLNGRELLHMGFFCHLIVEKALKAVIAEKTSKVPPKIHDLDKLAKRGGVIDDFSAKQLALLDTLNPLHIEARYPNYKRKIESTLTLAICTQILAETEEFLCWIKHRLEKLPKPM